MSILFMARHGQASFGKENYDVLSDLGVKQSGILADFFVNMNIRFDALYSGTMERQHKTAEIITARLRERGVPVPPHGLMPEFNEYDTRAIVSALMGDLIKEDPSMADEMERFFTDRRAFQKIFERVMLRWISGRYDVQGVETWKEVKARVAGGLSRVMRQNGRGKTVLIVASGGSIAASVQHVTDLPDEAAMRINWQMVNTSVTRFMYNDARMTLQSFNNFSHLEIAGGVDMVTYR